MSYTRFLDFQFSIKDHISIHNGAGDFPEIRVTNQYATACISLYGGQMLSFMPVQANEDLLFLSPDAVFDDGTAIRGGIPVCWPWFGQAIGPGLPAHGYARTQTWSIERTVQLADGSSQVVLQLPPGDYGVAEGLALTLHIHVGKTLLLELQTENVGDTPQWVSQALHSYLHVRKVSNCVIKGLDQVSFIDKLQDDKAHIQQGDLFIDQSVDRVYLTENNTICINDPDFNRSISIQNTGNDATVVWNPGEALYDLTADSFNQMVCIESAHLNRDGTLLQPNDVKLVSTEISVG